MYKKFKKRTLPILMAIIILFTGTVVNYQVAKAEPFTITAGVGAAAGGLTVGGILALGLTLVAVGYGAYLVVDNWEEITTECGDFLSNAQGNVKNWWDTICGSAVKADEPSVPLPEQLSKPGEVINFFDYYTPKGGGSDPNNNGDKFQLDPNVMGALYSFLLTYYGYDALTTDTPMSNDVLKSMNYLQLANSGKLQYAPAVQGLLNADPKNYNSIGLVNAGYAYALLTPNKSVDLYPDRTALFKIFNIPDTADSIFIGIKDNGSCYIHAMGYTGSAMTTQTRYPTDDDSRNVDYFYPSSTNALQLNQEPFLCNFGKYQDGAEYQKGFGWLTTNTSVNRYIISSDYKIETMDLTNDANHAAHNIPIAAWYTSAAAIPPYGLAQGNNYYAWDNVYYDDAKGSLTCGDYNVNFVGSENLNFFSYDYEDYCNKKSSYFRAMKTLTASNGAGGLAETLTKVLPGQNYTIPKSNYKIVVNDNETVEVNINEYLLDELSKIRTDTDRNTEAIIKAIDTANDKAIENNEITINEPIIKNGSNPIPDPGTGTVDLSETNALIEGLPASIAEAINVPDALSDAFTPSGDFTRLGNVGGSLGNFFNFSILYEYHEMIETFFTQRIGNNSPPVFSIYPKQSGLVYFENMPNKVDVIDFSFMEMEVFTWGISIRYFIRCILTFFVFGVWLNRTIKKLPGVVNGL
jgi:hypothetical protein